MECHHIVTNGPIVSTVNHEALVAMDTVIGHKMTRCPTYLKPYQHFTIRLSLFKCYKQGDNFPFDKMQRSPLNRSILINGEDGATLQVLNTMYLLHLYSVAWVHFICYEYPHAIHKLLTHFIVFHKTYFHRSCRSIGLMDPSLTKLRFLISSPITIQLASNNAPVT